MKRKIRVYIADDHKILIDGVIALLNTDEAIEVVGYSLTGKDVINWVTRNEADVLILDINMPDLDGIEVLKILRQRNFKIKTIILSGLSDAEIAQEMMNLGANGFIEKSSASEHIIKAIKSVNKGLDYFSEDIKKEMFSYFIQKTKDVEDNSLDLTNKELDILRLIVNEKSSIEIADELNISKKTVEAYRKKLFEKFKVKNVVGLAVYAVKNNIV